MLIRRILGLSDRAQALVYLLITGTMLGTSTVLAKLAAQAGLAPSGFLTWSLATAAVLLGLIATARRIPLRADQGRLPYYLIAGLVTIAAPYLIIFTATPVVGAGFVSLSIAFPPLLTYLGALLVRIERFDMLRACGVALALLGAVWLALGKLDEPSVSLGWIGLTLLIPVFLASGNIYRSLHWPKGARPEELAPGMLAAAALLLLILALATGQPLAMPLNGTAIMLLTAQTLTFTLQFLVFFMLQRTGGPVILSLLGAVAALVTVPLSVLVLAEDLPKGLLLGGLLIGAGIACVSRKPATY